MYFGLIKVYYVPIKYPQLSLTLSMSRYSLRKGRNKNKRQEILSLVSKSTNALATSCELSKGRRIYNSKEKTSSHPSFYQYSFTREAWGTDAGTDMEDTSLQSQIIETP